jgi:polyhydroxyalkanoate synthesis regulator phasin
MKKKFITILFRNLPNAAHFDFCSKVSRELEKAGHEVKMAMAALIIAFNIWLGKEDAQMTWVRKSELTEKIAEADRIVDHLLAAISLHIKNALYSSDQLMVDAARRLQIMLKKYGNVARKPYNEEAGDVQAIIEQIEGNYAADAALVGLGERFAALKSANTEFVTLLEQRDAYQLQKPDETFPVVRKGIEGVYHEIVVIADAGAALNLSPDYGAFIDSLNPEIERLNNQFNHARQDIAKAQPAPVPQQQYTGAPVTPTPDVFYSSQKGEETVTVTLELGRDYNISYKDNVNVGNAQCIIHGKGSYRGSKTVTFIIA